VEVAVREGAVPTPPGVACVIVTTPPAVVKVIFASRMSPEFRTPVVPSVVIVPTIVALGICKVRSYIISAEAFALQAASAMNADAIVLKAFIITPEF